MDLPPDVEFNRELGLILWRPRGVINEDMVNRIVRVLGQEEAASGKQFNRFTDSLQADEIDLNFNFIFHVSLFRRLSYRGPPVRSAILVPSSLWAHYFKMHAILTQGSALEVKIFEEREAAARWLKIPLETISTSEAPPVAPSEPG